MVPKSQKIEIPNTFNKQTGEITTLEWSSDGYVLAVGWKNGWGIFSVGGKCLASGFGVNEIIDEEKYVNPLGFSLELSERSADSKTPSCMGLRT